MGEVVAPKADAGRIEDHVRRALVVATARGEEIADAARERIGPAVEAIDAAVGTRRAAEEAEASSWAAVLAEDTKSDVAIGAIRDDMWSALGRPRGSSALQQVFPEGVRTYTAGDPRSQPALMAILSSRILASSAPQWTKELRESWVAQIEALRLSYEAAIQAHRPIEGASLVADSGYRAAIRTGQARLAAFKRDLKNLGLTEVQIHEIIPDASKATSAAAPSPPPATGPATRPADGSSPAGGA